MRIIMTTDHPISNFLEVNSWELANVGLKSIWRKQKYSDVRYTIHFDDGEEISGTIDMEPHSHFAPVCNEIFTWHLKTLWTNVSKSTKSYITQEDKEECKQLLTYLPIN